MTKRQKEITAEINEEAAQSHLHPSQCRCLFCFSRWWQRENPGKCHVCGGVRGHSEHVPPYGNGKDEPC